MPKPVLWVGNIELVQELKWDGEGRCVRSRVRLTVTALAREGVEAHR